MSSDTPPLHLVRPDAELLGPDPAESRLAELYTPRSRRHLRVNMVSSVDGAAWGVDGLSGSINDAADWRVFRVLRALADVVLVGAGTARAEGYTALGRPRGLEHLSTRPLQLAVVTRSGRVPPALLVADRAPWVVTGQDGATRAAADVGPERVLICPVADDPTAVDLAAGLDALDAAGLSHVLGEGGPHLLGDLLAADLVDELCASTTPWLVGAGPGRMVARPIGAQRPVTLGHLLVAPSGTQIARWELR